MKQAKVIADSKNEFNGRITTMIVTMPRMILAEFNTHRMFSRNSASSRAIPFEKMIKSVEENPFIPIAWQKDHKGMQGSEYLDFSYLKEHNLQPDVEEAWLRARDNAIVIAKELNDNGNKVTKQLCNRLLEPFMWHTVICTFTEVENFFALRCPKYEFNDGTGKIHSFRSKKDAIKAMPDLNKFGIYSQPLSNLDWLLVNKGQSEIHMMALAEAMWDAYNESTPKELKAGEWHIPFGDNISADVTKWSNNLTEQADLLGKNLTNLFIKVATARCARVSYTVVDEEGKEPNYENDIKLHDRLAASGHWSPFEHCARVPTYDEYYANRKGYIPDNEMALYESFDETAGWFNNFRGFIPYRYLLETKQ